MSTKKLTQDEFVARAKDLHGNKYDYSQTMYINSRTEISVICPRHGEFKHLAKTHLMGRGCPMCGNSMLKQDEFVQQARIVHHDFYDYSQSIYRGKKSKVSIICHKHGAFTQKSEKHLFGQGCPKCNRSELAGCGKTTQEQFIAMCRTVHGDRYDYTDAVFTDWHVGVIIVCEKHGSFRQVPTAHVHGKNGCPSCGFNTSIAGDAWISSFNKLHMVKEKVMNIGGKRFKVDGFDPLTNTIYEYFGSYWHGHPDRFNPDDMHPIRKIRYGDLYQATLDRIAFFKYHGYQVIATWGR